MIIVSIIVGMVLGGVIAYYLLLHEIPRRMPGVTKGEFTRWFFDICLAVSILVGLVLTILSFFQKSVI